MNVRRLILASRSEHRARLLREAGYEFDVVPSEAAEPALPEDASGVDAEAWVARLAWLKAREVARSDRLPAVSTTARRVPSSRPARPAEAGHDKPRRPAEAGPCERQAYAVLGCDSVVVCGRRILGKPAHEAHARRTLERLSGTRHAVLTGLCLWLTPENLHLGGMARTVLEMRPLTADEIRAYLATELWQSKAGAFGYGEGPEWARDWVRIVEGGASNVIGLPLELLEKLMGFVRHG